MQAFEDGWEQGTAEAWTRLRVRLADHVAEMGDDDLLLLEAEWQDEIEEGAAPYVQLCGWDGLVRLEVVSNHYLATAHRLTAADEAALVGLGFSRPTHGPDQAAAEGSPHFHLDLEPAAADRLAVLAVTALRDVFGVVHPAFLDTGDLEPDLVSGEPSGWGTAGPSDGSDGPDDGPAAVHPRRGKAHLQELVDEALTPFLGHAPQHDEDGDVPVVHGSAVVFVRVLEDVPVVRLFSYVVTAVQDTNRALFEVGVLNRDTEFVKFVWTGRAVMAYLDLPAWPFAGEHLQGMLALVLERVDAVGDDLATRLGGRTARREEDRDEDDGDGPDGREPSERSGYVAVLRVLRELDTAHPGGVDPALAAGVCEDDRDLVLEVLDRAQERVAAWRSALEEAAEDGDPAELEVAETELLQAERLTALLRGSLRVLVERQVAADREARHQRQARRGAGRRVPDPTLDEVDPGMWG